MLKMIAIGNLTGDPVLKTNEETGKPYAIMRIASDRRYKSPDGEKLTDFISIKVRGVLAERCAEFARKGCKIGPAVILKRSPLPRNRSGSPASCSKRPRWNSSRPGKNWTMLRSFLRQRNKRSGHPIAGWPLVRRKEFQT